jgi:hypothetical protein
MSQNSQEEFMENGEKKKPEEMPPVGFWDP